jgi:hypothetical protein
MPEICYECASRREIGYCYISRPKGLGLYTQVDLSEPRSGLTEQPRPSGLGKLHRNPP